MHAVLHRIKSWCPVSVWTTATVPTGVTDPASSGLGRNSPGSQRVLMGTVCSMVMKWTLGFFLVPGVWELETNNICSYQKGE